MKETLASRVSRIIAGSFHSLIDAVEDAAPEAVMEQAIREIDGAVADVRADLGTVEAQRHLATKRLAEENRRHEELAEQAALALDKGREDLATAAVERQIDIEAQLPILQGRIAELGDEKAKLEGFVTALQAKKREMREELSSFRRSQAAKASPTGTPTGRKGESVDYRAERATGAFDRIYERQTGLKGTSGTSNQTAARLAELEDLARQNRVQERLAQLKAKADR
ncbi:PspA/IM30 family protein [Solimonas sp. SE-A11]|uniref:PspA/IM30 family protein n=1 Tax=Solimonas sp. SE-A11 TaxID=3054954 RepID=UPI00259D264D|nr:PspA/IM30 family protein [Solimonas sp. SE-A11]MDM4770323.1 PspA/IM30 family protein [Solimonas sp. SE-A11]